MGEETMRQRFDCGGPSPIRAMAWLNTKLGFMYQNGCGVPQDDAAASYQKAAGTHIPCRLRVISAVFAVSATSPLYLRLRKDFGSAANRR
jgi:hypothetical protein